MLLYQSVRDDPGWHLWIVLPPPPNWLSLEIWRTEWPAPRLVTPSEIYPEMNVDGLYWRAP